MVASTAPRHWRILVSGVGTAGERHIRNLLALGQNEIAVHRSRGHPYRTLERAFETYADLGRALAEWRPEVVLVTGATSLHLTVATEAAEAGCHVFVEKPLANTTEGLDRLEQALARHDRLLMVGYMLRFHPLLRQVKAWLADGTLGQPLHWRSTWGEYLPDWHPWEDYRMSYAARRELGGGPALTFSHDIDLALWLFGPVERGSSMTIPASPLRMDVPPGVDLLLKHHGGVVANLHLDFYQRPPQRAYEIIATKGRAVLDYYAGSLTRHAYPEDDAVTPQGLDVAAPTEVAYLPPGWDRNDMFVAELCYFLECLERGKAPEPGLIGGIAATRLAQALGDGENLYEITRVGGT
jgi:predicted dehydrogenase